MTTLLKIIPFVLLFNSLTAQNKITSQTNWSSNPFEQLVFIENNGQFENTYQFKASRNGTDFYFTNTGLIFHHDKFESINFEKEEEKSKEKKDDKERKKVKTIAQELQLEWLNTNPNVQIKGLEQTKFYYTFSVLDKKTGKGILAHAYSKIVYENLYPGIDVEYILPANSECNDGIKYSLIVHPGADLSVVKIRYSGSKGLSLDSKGNLIIKSVFGTFTDHAPFTFYKDNSEVVESNFVINQNTITFNLNSFDKSRTIVIDPWTSSPTFLGYNAAYDINFDNNGNVYAYGSNNPFKEAKFDNTGALIWIYNMSAISTPYGDFAVDEGTGISYIGEGKTGPTLVHKIDVAGIEIGQSIGDPDMGEIWRMAFNSVTNKIILAGGSGNNYAAALDTNLTELSIPFGNGEDMVLLTVDNCSNNDIFIASCASNQLYSMPGTVGPPTFQVSDGYGFTEVGSVFYAGGNPYAQNGFNGIAASPNFLYTYDGATVKKWDKITGAAISSFVVTGTPYLQGGLDVDACDNLYVGHNNSIEVYDVNFILIATYPLPDEIYDLKLGLTNILYACGKTFVTSIDLPNPVISTQQSPATCSLCNGSATVNGLCSSATYLWAPGGQTTQTAVGLCAGTYTVTVTTCSNVYSDTVLITNSGSLTLSSIQTNELCNGGNTGSITVTPTSGTGPFTYLWSNSQTTQTATNLGIGSYTVTVTDVNGCSTQQSFTITQPLALAGTTTVTNLSCNSICNGTATGIGTGGTGPYTYLWNNSQATATATGLCLGSYTVTITDANGCTTTQTATITQPSVLTATTSAVNLSCNAVCNGTATGVGVGGTGPYTYLWNNSQSTATATSLCAGVFTVTVTDANGCTTTQTVTVTQPTVITASANATQSSCTINNGSATVTASGGTPSYTYAWAPSGGTNSTANNLGAGTYTCTIMDANGCTQTATAVVTNANAPTVTLQSQQDVLCNGGSNGTAAVNATGGTPGYTYVWTPTGGTSSTGTGFSAGTYTCTITDAAGCIVTQSVTITQPVAISITATSAPDTCNQSNGSATANASGGVGPYTYAWNTGPTTQTINNLTSNTFTVTVTDANGCVQTQTILVGITGSANANAGSDITIAPGNSTTLTATGGSTYSWSPATGLSCTNCANPIASPAVTTTYIVVVTNANGCTDIDSVTVFVEVPCVMTSLTTLLPNAFSPNGDVNNDQYCVPANTCITSFDLKIYDRWGELIFESQSLDNCWDGNYKGKPLNSDVFVYYFNAVLSDGSPFSQKGNITLMK